MESQNGEELITKCNKCASALFNKAQDTVIYRPSIAYILQHIKSFLSAIQQFKAKNMTPLEVRALERFIGIVNHFTNVLPNLSAKWTSSILNLPSTHMHDYIDKFRKTLVEICRQLSLNSDEVIVFDSVQDQVNKVADLQYLKAALREVRSTSISVTNAVDVQQLIEVRLNSIQQHLPSKQKRSKIPGITSTPPDANDSADIYSEQMETALDQFRDIDIPDEDLVLDNPLGTGGFGTVFLGTRVSTGELLAVKQVRSDKLSMSTWASLYSEVAIMAKFKHRYVLELVGAHVKQPYRIITRYCGGRSLFDRLHRSNGVELSPLQLTALAYQVASGMKFLHRNGIVHRDLKTMNILLSDNDVAKIADFGLCGLMKDNKDLIGGVGTPHYTAPEVLDHRRYGPRVDTYSYGVILWEMATGQIPFREKTHAEIVEHVVQRGWRLPIPQNTPEGLRKLITRCWSANPNDRPDFDEIVELFRSGSIRFFDCPEITDPNVLEAGDDRPPLNLEYVTKVLMDPGSPVFSGLVDFIVGNMSERFKKELPRAKIVGGYTSSSPNASHMLLVTAELLEEGEFESFIERVAVPIIVRLNESNDLSCALRFMLKVPMGCFGQLRPLVGRFVDEMSDGVLGPLVLQLLARMGGEDIETYSKQLVDYLTEENVAKIGDQATVDALVVVARYVIDRMEDPAVLIPVLEKEIVVPPEFLSLLIGKTSGKCVVRLVVAMLQAARRIDITEVGTPLIIGIGDEEMKMLANQEGVFDLIDILLSSRKNVRAALLILFRLTTVPEVGVRIANHHVLSSLLELDGFSAQRLQIFTSLFSSEEFLEDTTVSDGVLKLLVSSMSRDELMTYAIRMIGALSSHAAGCRMIADTGMLALFAQLFLSPRCSDVITSMTILRNITAFREPIPQVSLIISCLMQDLTYSSGNKQLILQTLLVLVRENPESVQEHDLQNVVLPLVSRKSEPGAVVMALRIFASCEAGKLRGFANRLTTNILRILGHQEMQLPEVILAAVDVILLLQTQFDILDAIAGSRLPQFLESAVAQMNAFPKIRQEISNGLLILKAATSGN